MAVVDPQTPNLAPAYGNIINTINQQAERSSRPRPMSTTGALLTTAADTAADILKREREKKEQEDLLKFKFELEDKVKKSDFVRKMEGEGRKQITAQYISALANKIQVDPVQAQELASSLIGGYYTPKEVMEFINSASETVYGQKLINESLDEEKNIIGAAGTKEAAQQKLKNRYPTGTGKGPRITTLPSGEKAQVVEDADGNIQLIQLTGGKGGVKKNLDDLDKNDRTEVARMRQQFQTNVVKTKREAIDAADQAINALNSKNPILDVGVRVKLAKAFGDSGNISIVEQTQYGSSPEIKAQIDDFLSKKTTGKISEQNRNYLLEAAKALKNGSQNALDDAAESEATVLQDTYGFDKKAAKKYLGGTLVTPEFDSIEEAENAKLKPGTYVKIKGRPAVIE